MRNAFEKLAEQMMRERLKGASGFYKRYLEASLADLRGISGGYFAKDNGSKDEFVADEVREILHDKESLLSLKNVRRFIFSHRTLGVGWDNPNVFTICKFGGSGSEIEGKKERLAEGFFKAFSKSDFCKNLNINLHFQMQFEDEGIREILKKILL